MLFSSRKSATPSCLAGILRGFELLRRYLVKHSPETLEDLDFEAINKEIEVDEVVQVAQAIASTGEDPPMPENGGNDAPGA